MGAFRKAVAVTIACLPCSAMANITDITLSGTGTVNDYQGDPFFGVPQLAVGTPVSVFVSIHLGSATGDPFLGYDPAPVDGFTGTYTLTGGEIADGYAYYAWSVNPGDYANTNDQAATDFGDTFTFDHGVLTAFSIGYQGDPDSHSLSEKTWSFDYAYGQFDETPPSGGGTWNITYNSTAGTDTVPEPASWTLMIAGFGLIGGVQRGRTRAWSPAGRSGG